MTTDERDRIVSLGRERGAELAASVASKTATLRTLGWPAALTEVRQRSESRAG